MGSKPLSKCEDDEEHGGTSYCLFSVLKLTSGSSPVFALLDAFQPLSLYPGNMSPIAHAAT